MQDLVGVAGPLVQGDLVEAKELDLTVLSVYPSVGLLDAESSI